MHVQPRLKCIKNLIVRHSGYIADRCGTPCRELPDGLVDLDHLSLAGSAAGWTRLYELIVPRVQVKDSFTTRTHNTLPVAHGCPATNVLAQHKTPAVREYNWLKTSTIPVAVR
jgi:hypothetical protein